jgi:hypothetical protein
MTDPQEATPAPASIVREQLPGGVIVARALDPTLPEHERDYQVDLYPDGSVGAQTLLVHKPGGAAAALEVAKAQPWIRVLLYPRRVHTALPVRNSR